MRKIGIVAEYNPFHNGHKYQIDTAKKLSGVDYVVICMSGNFVQRGEPALIDKDLRAQMAIDNGASLVIELPAPFAFQSASDFAWAAIGELKKMGITDLSFGAETENVKLLRDIAEMQLKSNSKYDMILKANLKSGKSFSNASLAAIKECYNDKDDIANIFKSNNILAIEYIKACILLDFHPNLIVVKRMGIEHSDDKVKDEEKFASAMSLRNKAFEDPETIEKYMPANAYNQFMKVSNFNKLDYYFEYFKFVLLRMDKDELSSIYGMEEGIENRIFELIFRSVDFDDFFEKAITKRYGMAKISRLITNTLLGIKKSDVKEVKENFPSYVKILAMNGKGKKILSELRGKQLYITKYSDYLNNGISPRDDMVFKITNRSVNIFNKMYLDEFKINLEYKNHCKYRE